jgi:hypothetical protein
MDSPDMHGARDILERMHAQRFKCAGDLARYLVVNLGGDRNSTRIGERLEARRNVHALAVEIGALADDIAKVDADAQLDRRLAGRGRIGLAGHVLQLQRGLDRTHRARKLKQRAVAHQLHDPPAMRSHDRVKDVAAAFLQAIERALLAGLHEA